MKLFPSLLAADFSCPAPQIRSLRAADVNRLHLDVMDGRFVPNISLGFPVIRSVAERFPEIDLDVHLMIENPANFTDSLVEIGVDWVSVHIEARPEVSVLAKNLNDNGIRFGIAVNPDTEIKRISQLLDRVDYVLVMTIQPGFGGQSFREDVLPKIERLRSRFDGPIQVDGGIGEDTIERAAKAGANWFVSGSSVFGGEDPGERASSLIEVIQK